MARRLSSRKDNGPGHNSGVDDDEQLRDFRDRVVTLMREQKAIGDDIKKICADGAERGVASAAEIRALARESLKDPDTLRDKLTRMVDLRSRLGMFADTDLGAAAMAAAEDRPRRGRPPQSDTPSAASLQAAREHLEGENDDDE